MKKGLFTIIENRLIADKTWKMRLSGECHGFTGGGQFADIAIDGRFLRRPIAVREWDNDGFDIIYKTVGEGTEQLSRTKEGTVLDILTGLGNGFDAGRCAGRSGCLCVGDVV